MDVTELVTPQQLNAELMRLSRQLDADHANLIRMCSVWAHADNDYKMAKAKEYLRAQGTVQAREASVVLATEKERLAAHLAEGLKGAAKLKVEVTLASLSAWQSMGAGVRAEMALSGRFET